ncbi:hypothetical protein L1987_69749 [Smallanthus sonchifolius]|uniref:Uncharacterized protein n=1 Tax=Smallanthus sonchifolius TaxID=185202 RepID=A0ACB9B6N0_9ASTR|nr:hypothetical protein L1987_69749 [Smallanthus sonchifolius]
MPMQVSSATLDTWLPEQVVIQKAESAARSADMAKEAAEIVSLPKFEAATDLFDMLSMDGSEATSADDLWA